jgi:hypothetical protein
VNVKGTTPETIAEAVALYTEEGGGTTQNPGWMIQRLTNLGKAGMIGTIDQWTPTFRNRTGQNVNVSVNAVGKLLTLLAQAN